MTLPAREYEPCRSEYQIEHYLPSPPDVLFGREEELKYVKDVLLQIPPARPRLAIIGAGGMGKTSLALVAMHDHKITENYSKRYFVSCEAVSTIDELLFEIADAVGTPTRQRDRNVKNLILSRLNAHRTLLCLDNFETPWEVPGLRKTFEDFLRLLNGLSQLSIVLTMRGIQYPSVISWTKPMLAPLTELTVTDRTHIFSNIAERWDEYAEKLLDQVGGVPLAIVLLATVVQQGGESTQGLWERWDLERTSLADTGGADRLSSLDLSIKVSIESPRMRACPSAIDILSMFARLPHGFPERSPLRDELLAKLPVPEDRVYQKSVQVLKQVALIYSDETSRLRLLPPIRHFCLIHHQCKPTLQAALVDAHISFLTAQTDFMDTWSHGIVRPELSNATVLFHEVLDSTINADLNRLLSGVDGLISWGIHCGIARTLPSLADRALQYSQDISPNSAASLCAAAGGCYRYVDQLGKAEEALSRALALHRQAHDVVGEADDLLHMGELYRHRNELDKAEEAFSQALALHRQAHDVLGVANDLQRLGELYTCRHELEKAEKVFSQALALHRQAQDVVGEANDLRNLGWLYMCRDELDKAGEAFSQALALHRQAQHILGEANDLQNLGQLYMCRNELDRAQDAFTQALTLHRQAQNVLGEANNLQNLGQLHVHRDELDKAEEVLSQALILHRQAQDILGEANDLHQLGLLYRYQHKLHKAEDALAQALALHRKAQAVLGEAYDLLDLEKLCTHRDELDEVEAMLSQTLALN
jgi:tetratricopeptide (TPR) repeat protein